MIRYLYRYFIQTQFKSTMKTKTETSLANEVIKLLRKNNLSVTKPRKLILSFLLSDHGPFSIEEIHKGLGKNACDLATVYRCMGQFEKEGLVERRYFGDETFRYEIRDGSSHHHHVICKNCKGVSKMSYCFISEIEKMIRDQGYTDVTHTLEFFGICPACKAA